MKKRITALLLALTLAAGLTLPAAWAASEETALRTVKALGIMVGDENGDMALDREVTRAEFAKLLVAASTYKDSVTSEGAGYSLYKDVKSGYWASEYIRICAQQGWMIGYTDGTFGPYNTITLEEACTAALRPLGYDSSSLQGTFPYAQLNKADAVGLRDDLNRRLGERMTRRDCAILICNMLTAKTSGDRVYATTLGYTVTNGEVDYSSAILTDVKGPYVASWGETLPFQPLTVYRDGELSSSADLTANEVYYYNSKVRTLWIYTKQATGLLTALTPSASAPTAVTVGGKSYTLASADLSYRLSALAGGLDNGAVTLLLGMDGKAAELLKAEGPFVAKGGDALPIQPVRIYRDGALTQNALLSSQDVYYYNAQLATLWIYTDQVSGRVTQLTPSAAKPETVTVGGTAYQLAEEGAKDALSALGEKAKDSYVTLLLGMDGQVAQVLTGDQVDDIYCGLLTKAVKDAGDSRTATPRTTLTVICADGETRSFLMEGTTNISANTLVRVTVTGKGVDVDTLATASTSGRVSGDGSMLGITALSRDVQILDVSSTGEAVSVLPERLAGVSLRNEDIKYYSKDRSGAIDVLILNDVTGDTWSYGYLTAAETRSGGNSSSSSLTWLEDGKETSKTFSASYSVTPGGIAMRSASDGALKSIRQLTEVSLSAMGTRTASSSNRTFELAENVQVYLRKDKYYLPTTLSAVNGQDYVLIGWYDSFSGPAGGLIRVIIASERE